MDAVIIGFTGSRRQPSGRQIAWLRQYLNVYRPDLNRDDHITELHHGGCIGSDAFAHMIALRAGIPLVVHPPINKRFLYVNAVAAHRPPHQVTVLPAKPYLDRDRDVVDAATRLIALPDGPPRPRSGTWFTISYAMKNAAPVTICWPDGTIETR